MKLITANKLNRFWKNGILPELGKRIANSRVLKTPEEVEANTNEENIVSANVVGELINNLGGLHFYEDVDGNKYVVGADSVPKKLGNAFTDFTTEETVLNKSSGSSTSLNGIYTFTKDYKHVAIIMIVSGHGYSATGSITSSYQLQKGNALTVCSNRKTGYWNGSESSFGQFATMTMYCFDNVVSGDSISYSMKGGGTCNILIKGYN